MIILKILRDTATPSRVKIFFRPLMTNIINIKNANGKIEVNLITNKRWILISICTYIQCILDILVCVHTQRDKQKKNPQKQHKVNNFLYFGFLKSFWLPSVHNMCSLAKAVHSLLLGRDIKEYIQCLANIATVIADLHSYGLVMRDFSAYTIYIEKDPTATGQMTKVNWRISISCNRL